MWACILYIHMAPGRVAQSVTCLATDACLTADPGVASLIPVRSHTFVEIDHEMISTVILLLPLIHSRRVVVSKNFQEVGAGKGSSKGSNISSINHNGVHIEDPSELANTFNNFFANVAGKIKEPVTHSNHDKLKDFCNSRLPDNIKFSISNIEKDQVLNYLSTMDSCKATGTDNIGPRLLKFAAPYIAGDISYICNHSINSSTFPRKWKEANVSPLHKNGPHDDVNNYRPISILPVLSKVLEKHVHDCLPAYLKEYNLLHKTQSGFRSQHSCETALVHMIDTWLNAMDNGKMIGVVLVDFKKAFDLVDHKILLSKFRVGSHVVFAWIHCTEKWRTSFHTDVLSKSK